MTGEEDESDGQRKHNEEAGDPASRARRAELNYDAVREDEISHDWRRRLE